MDIEFTEEEIKLCKPEIAHYARKHKVSYVYASDILHGKRAAKSIKASKISNDFRNFIEFKQQSA